MRELLERTCQRLREEPPRQAMRASGYEAAAATVGRLASGLFGRLERPASIWEHDWDVLCLLDGCRLDLMCEAAADGHEVLRGPAEVDHLWSVGSQSAEWMAKTFAPEYRPEIRRTAYVTGNPFSGQAADYITGVDGDVLPLSGADFGVLYEAWRDEWIDDDVSTIPPAPLTDAAIAVWRDREALGVDRVVVHYMQPHAPFRSRPEWFLGTADLSGWGSPDDDADPGELDQETMEFLEAFDTGADEVRDPWTRLRNGELPFDAFWEAYRDNLAWALDDLARLRENCDGRIVLTSDHGNAAGEYGVWSHPPGVHLPALRRVPWVEVDGEDRGTARPDLPDRVAAGTAPDADVGDRLADLGYR